MKTASFAPGNGASNGKGNATGQPNGQANPGSTGTVVDTTTSDSKLPLSAQQAPGIAKGTGLANRSAQAAANSRNLEKNPHYATSGGDTGGGPGGSTSAPGTASNQDNFLYYYHPDHLGSSSYVTDSYGKVFQHLEYFPYVHQQPLSKLDPDGKETWFVGGAGVNGGYIADMTSKLSAAGICHVRAATPQMASFGHTILDAAMVTRWNQYLGDGFYARYQGKVHLNLPAGEQLNLIGYSHGSIVAAQTALSLAAGGQRVDNLVLIGAPINQDLLDAVKNNKNIAHVHIINLTDKGDPLHAGMTDFEIIKSVPTFAKQQSEGTGHFYYAPDTKEGQARRTELANELKRKGLE